jgi:hypothetical protein
VVAASAAVAAGQDTIHAISEVDITEPRRLMREHRQRTGALWFLPVSSATVVVTVGGIVERPVLGGGGLEAREHLCLTHSFDHAIVDGAPAARFVRRLTQLLGSGEALLEASRQEEDMNVLGSRIAIAGTLLMLSAISGVIVSSLGRPLNTAVFAVLVVLTLQRNFGMGPAALVLTVLTGVCLLSLFVSGALLSLDRPVSALLLAVHKLAPLLTLLSAALLL